MFQKKSVEFTLGRYGWCASVFLAACLLVGCVTNFAFGAVTFSYSGNTRTLSGNGTYSTYLNFYSNLQGQPYAYNTYFDSSGGEIVLTLTNAMTGWSNAYGVDVTTAGGKNGNLMYEVRTGTLNLRGAYNYSASWLHFNIDSGATFRTTNRKWYDSTKTNGTNPKFFGSGTYEVYDDNYADWVFRNSTELAADGFCASVGNLSYFTGTVMFRNIRVGISDAFATGQFQFYQNGSWGNWTLGVVDGGQLFVGYQSTTTTITRNLYLEGDNWVYEADRHNGALRFGGGPVTISGNITIGANGAKIMADNTTAAATLSGTILGGTAQFSAGGTSPYTYVLSGANKAHTASFNIDSNVTVAVTNQASLGGAMTGDGTLSIEDGARVYTTSTNAWNIGALDVKSGSQMLFHNAATYTVGTITLRGISGYQENTTIGDGTKTYGALRLGDQVASGSSITLNANVVLAADSKIGISNGSNVTLNGVISGDYGLTIVGSPTGTVSLLLNGANTYAGGTTINTGGLTVLSGVANALPTSTILTMGAGTFDLNGKNQELAGLSSLSSNVVVKNTGSAASTLTINTASGVSYDYAGLLTNGGTKAVTLVKTGAGTQMLSALNSYTGGTTVNAGTLKMGASGAVLGSGIVTFNGNDATIDLNGKNLAINGTVAASGLTNVGFRNSASTKSTLTVGDNTGNHLFYGFITGNVALNKTGTDSLRLTYDYDGNSKTTFTGDLTLAGGNIYAYYGKEFGSGTIYVTGTGTQIINNGGAQTATATLSSYPDIANNIVMSIGNANQVIIRAGWNNYAGRETGMILRGNITGTGGILFGSEQTPGYITLYGNNTYGGNTTIASSNIKTDNKYAYWGFILDTNSAFGTGTVTVNRDTRWEFNTSDVARRLDNASIVLDNSSNLMLMATDGAHTILTGSQTGTALTANCGEGTGANAVTISSNISGTGTIYAGKGTVILTGTNSYAGATTVTEGTLKIAGSGTIGPTGDVTVNNGTLDINTNATMNISANYWWIGKQANESAVVNLTSGTLNFVSGHKDFYIGGYFGVGSLLENCNATMNQTGGTINTTGWLNIGEWATGEYNLSGGSVTVSYFCVGRRGTGTLNLSGDASITVNTYFEIGSDYAESPAATYGTVNQTGGTVTTPSLRFGSHAKQMDHSTTSVTTAIYNLLGGVLNLTGTLAAANGTHNHQMNISGTGQLVLDTTSAISGLALSMGGSGDGNGAVLFKKTTAINNAVTLTDDVTIGVKDSMTGTISGSISGEGKALTKVGSGTLVLSGANTYTGATSVTGGTLSLSGGSLTSEVTVTGGALQVSGGSTLTGNVFVRSGSYNLENCTIDGDFIAYYGVEMPTPQTGTTITGTLYRGVDSVGELSSATTGAFYFDAGTTLRLTMPTDVSVSPQGLVTMNLSELQPESEDLFSVTSFKRLSTGEVVPTDDVITSVTLTKLALHDGMTLDVLVSGRPATTETGWIDLLTATDGIDGDLTDFDTLNLNFGFAKARFGSGDLSAFLQMDSNRLQINSLRVLEEYNRLVNLPEPSTYLLLVLGVVGMGAWTRRKTLAKRVG